MNLQSLSHFCTNLNLGGILTIEYVPTIWVNRSQFEIILSDDYNFQKPIPLLYGQWLKAPVLPKGRLWDEKHKPDKQGGYHNQEINGVMPAMRPQASGTLNLMANLRFLARLTDGNGRPWLIGSLETPLRFTVKSTTASEGGLNNYTIQFYSQTPQKAWGYLPVI